MLVNPKKSRPPDHERASFVPENGALGGIRTHDLCLRRAALYPLSYKRIKTLKL